MPHDMEENKAIQEVVPCLTAKSMCFPGLCAAFSADMEGRCSWSCWRLIDCMQLIDLMETLLKEEAKGHGDPINRAILCSLAAATLQSIGDPSPVS